jgi:predicted RNase H-like HicB family nuclease
MKRYPIEIEDDDVVTNAATEVTVTPEIRTLARRPYAVVVTVEDDSGWIGRVPDLPGLVAAGDTLDEMMEDLEGAKEVYIASLILRGHSVPDPRPYDAVANVRSGIAAR